MISLLTGSIRHLTTEKVVIEVGGVGYSLSHYRSYIEPIGLGCNHNTSHNAGRPRRFDDSLWIS
ncbi:MAG: RuvA terminal domain [Actinomycetota bacterium]